LYDSSSSSSNDEHELHLVETIVFLTQPPTTPSTPDLEEESLTPTAIAREKLQIIESQLPALQRLKEALISFPHAMAVIVSLLVNALTEIDSTMTNNNNNVSSRRRARALAESPAARTIEFVISMFRNFLVIPDASPSTSSVLGARSANDHLLRLQDSFVESMGEEGALDALALATETLMLATNQPEHPLATLGASLRLVLLECFDALYRGRSPVSVFACAFPPSISNNNNNSNNNVEELKSKSSIPQIVNVRITYYCSILPYVTLNSTFFFFLSLQPLKKFLERDRKQRTKGIAELPPNTSRFGGTFYAFMSIPGSGVSLPPTTNNAAAPTSGILDKTTNITADQAAAAAGSTTPAPPASKKKIIPVSGLRPSPHGGRIFEDGIADANAKPGQKFISSSLPFLLLQFTLTLCSNGVLIDEMQSS